MIYLHLKDTIKNFIYDQNYYISLFNGGIYLYNYLEMKDFKDDYIYFIFEEFKLEIFGDSFSIQNMLKKELYITGIIKDIKIYYE